MKCDEVRQLHGPCLDSELDARTTLEIQQHVAACLDCARMFAAAAKLDARITTGLKQGQRTAALWEQAKQQVVAAAESAARPRSSTLDPRPGLLSTLNHQLSTLLWPHPKAWAGLAAVWVVILTVNFAARDPLPVREARNAMPAARSVLLALQEQEQLLAELTGPPPPRHVEKPRPTAPSPRSQRREQNMSA